MAREKKELADATTTLNSEDGLSSSKQAGLEMTSQDSNQSQSTDISANANMDDLSSGTQQAPTLYSNNLYTSYETN